MAIPDLFGELTAPGRILCIYIVKGINQLDMVDGVLGENLPDLVYFRVPYCRSRRAPLETNKALAESNEKAKQAVELLLLLNFVPGQCQICRRLGI